MSHKPHSEHLDAHLDGEEDEDGVVKRFEDAAADSDA